ncbi:MAG: hypothetical protein IT318_08030 [Anaerolineales bacterium]|nr:hypothetical protein [Anaerolineales bacterium]
MADQTASWNSWNGRTADNNAWGEWPVLYAQYLLRAAKQSSRTSQLYQQVLDAVARGELAATVFQDMAPAYIQARGPAYASRMAEISSRFFGRMVQIDAAAAHDLVSLVLSAPVALPPAAPPEMDPGNPILWYQKLMEYASQLGAATVAAYQGLLERVAAGEIEPNEVQAASANYLQQHLPEHLNQLGSLYLELLNSLNDLRAEYEEDFLTGVLAAAERPGQETPPALHLVAPLGETTSTSLSLTNTRPEPALVRCSVTDVRRADGVGSAFASQIAVVPAEISLPPNGQGSLLLSLRLDAHDFVPDVLYVGAIHVERAGEPRLEIPLRIAATATTKTEAAAGTRKRTKRAAAKGKPAKRQR